jgi:hypothetical protein
MSDVTELEFKEDSASGFACSCSAENREKLKELREWAYAKLSGPTDQLREHRVTAENFLTAMIHYLNWQYWATIEGFPVDMWGAVEVGTYPRAKIKFNTYIQCDEFEDGLALTLKAFVEKFGDEENSLLNDEEWKERQVSDGKLQKDKSATK